MLSAIRTFSVGSDKHRVVHCHAVSSCCGLTLSVRCLMLSYCSTAPVTIAIAAVSTLSLLGPKPTLRAPASLSCFISCSVKSPSGPISRRHGLVGASDDSAACDKPSDSAARASCKGGRSLSSYKCWNASLDLCQQLRQSTRRPDEKAMGPAENTFISMTLLTTFFASMPYTSYAFFKIYL